MAERERRQEGAEERLEERLARLEERLERLLQQQEEVNVARRNCDTRSQQFSITNTDVGYGCSKEDAARNFFNKLLDRVDATMHCTTSTCNEGDCEPEIVDTAQIELLIKYNRVRVPVSQECPGNQGWKAFVHDQPNLSTPFQGRCTCVVLV